MMAMVDLMSLYRLAGGHFVQDGHHRVGWIDAEVTEFRSSKSLSAVQVRNHPTGATTT